MEATTSDRAESELAVRVPVDAADDWDWEAFRVGGRLFLYCYLRETVLIPLTSGSQ